MADTRERGEEDARDGQQNGKLSVCFRVHNFNLNRSVICVCVLCRRVLCAHMAICPEQRTEPAAGARVPAAAAAVALLLVRQRRLYAIAYDIRCERARERVVSNEINANSLAAARLDVVRKYILVYA